MNYVVFGSNDYLINSEIRKIKDKYNIKCDDIVNYDFNETKMSVIIDDAYNMPLFSENKLIIVDNINSFDGTGKKDELLENYLSNSNKNTIIIFIDHTDKLDERKKIVKSITKCECNNININDFAKKLFLEYEISTSTLNILIDRVGTNLYNLEQEINKLKIYKINDKKITDQDILFASKNIEDDIFSFVDYIVKKNTEKVLEIYNDLLKKNNEPIALIVMISNQFRLLYQVKELYLKGNNESTIASILEVHPYRVKLALEKCHNYTSKILLSYLEKLADLDYDIKSGNIEADSGLELFLLDM